MRGISALSFALLAAGTAVNAMLCSTGLYIIVARGSEELKGVGVSGEIADMIADKVVDSSIVSLNYPATILDPPYESSEADGVENIQKLLDEYHEACPDNKIAILGYSQGAQVTMDVLCGGSGGLFTVNKPIDSQVVKNVVAVALYGDPTFVANLTYDRGTGTRGGIFDRNDTSVCLEYSSRIISYCDANDVYCDQGSNFTVHHQYIEKYGSQIAEWVVEKFRASQSKPSAPMSVTAPASASASSSSETGLSSASSATPTAVIVHSAASGLAPATSSSLVFGAGLLTMLSAASWML